MKRMGKLRPAEVDRIEGARAGYVRRDVDAVAGAAFRAVTGGFACANASSGARRDAVARTTAGVGARVGASWTPAERAEFAAAVQRQGGRF